MATKGNYDWSGTIVGLIFFGFIAWAVIGSFTSGPTITTEDVQVSSVIAHEEESDWSDDYDLGDSAITQEGVDGELIKQYTVTYEDDVEVSRELVDEWVESEPITQVTTYGTYEEPEYYYTPSYTSNYGSYNDAGCVKNQYVSGYTRGNGTYVSGYWRNSPSDNCY